MEKVIRNGKVAVLVSRGFRTGWYTHHGIQELLFHPKVVEMVEECKKQDICKFVDEALNVEVSRDGAMGIVIHWLPVGGLRVRLYLRKPRPCCLNINTYKNKRHNDS
jgi:hypothetical protein